MVASTSIALAAISFSSPPHQSKSEMELVIACVSEVISALGG